MSYARPPLVWLRTFEASASQLSFARAAQELGLTAAAVSQQIRSLESHLGLTLFERLPRGVKLTATGRAYLPTVRRALDDLAMATIGLVGTASKRTLTIRCSVSFASLCLAPRLHMFRSAYPGVQIRLYASIWSDDLDDDRVDIDIRFGDGRWDGFDVEAVSLPISIPVCPPATAFSGDPAATLFELARASPIHIVGCENLWAQMGRALGWPDDAIDSGLCVDTSLIALEMVAAGSGSAMISRDLARQHCESGRVQAPPGIELRHDQCHYVLMPRRKRAHSADALAFRRWLLEPA
jgi:LysR family glycine cleavage system transcriptional activator